MAQYKYTVGMKLLSSEHNITYEIAELDFDKYQGPVMKLQEEDGSYFWTPVSDIDYGVTNGYFEII